jgi:uncharacterized protein (UPF0548 family)
MLASQCCAGGVFGVAKRIQRICGSAVLRRNRSFLPLLALALIAAAEVLSMGARAAAQQGPMVLPPLVSGPGALPPLGPIAPGNRARATGRKNLTKALTSELLPPPSPIFLAAPTYGSGGEDAYSVAVADVNGDGEPDMVVANYCASSSSCTNGSVSVLLGNGDGTFQAPVSYGSGGEYSYSVAVADVNGDGKPDLLVANYCASSSSCTNGSVSVLLGNGDGTFQTAVSYSSGGEDAWSVAVADVNGDGKPDLLVTNACVSSSNCAIGSVSVLLGNGDGTFQTAVSYGSGGEYSRTVAVRDVNGDGKPDLLVANECASNSNCANGSVSVLLGNGDGTFRTAVSYGSGGEDTFSVAVADVNGDGKPDLLVTSLCASNTNCANGSVSVLLGNGDGTFQTAVSYGSGGEGTFSVVVAEVNGDGKPDLLVANECGSNNNCANGSVSVLLGNGDGTFQAALSYDSGGYYAFSVAVGDVNGDGKPDLVVANLCVSGANCANGLMAVLLGNGDGTFQAAVSYGPGGYAAYSVAVGDVNGDGKPDLVVANYCASNTNCTNGSVSVLLGNGDGTFQTAVSYASGGEYSLSVAMADVNGDGKPDLIVANDCASNSNCANGSASVLLGNGDGTFQTAVSFGSGGTYSYSVAVADVNGDGKPDLLVTNECSSGCTNGSVSVLLGNGDGTFQTAVSYVSGGVSAQSVAVADVNGDGKPDLLVANDCASNSNCANGSVSVLLGNGDGTFQTAVSYGSGGASAFSVAVGDMNGDGKPDLVVANECASNTNCTNGAVSVLLGNGDGTFQTALATSTPELPSATQSLALADFNGDGKLDVASGAGNVLLLGNGDGTFQTPYTLGAGGSGIAVGDFNLDGRPDLAVGGVTILLNISTGFVSATTTTVSASPNPSSFGQSVTITATITSAFNAGPLTGTVTFYDGTTSLGSAAVSSGQATLSTSTLPLGANAITASYGGNTKYQPSASAVLTETVNTATTTTTLSSSLNPSSYNQPVTFTSSVSSLGGTPTGGTVTFMDGTTALGTLPLAGSGVATFTTATLSVGTHSIAAIYSGTVDFSGSTSSGLSQVVQTASTTTAISSSLNPSNDGQSVTFTAKLSWSAGGTPTGTVTFLDGTTTIGTSVVNGSGIATFSISTLSVGTHSITAAYSGDSNFSASTSPVLSQGVVSTTTSTAVTSSLNPSTESQSVTFTVTVNSAGLTPTGTVRLTDGSTMLGTLVLNGSGIATFTTSTLSVGTQGIQAAYSGDANNSPSTSPVLNQVVQKASTTTALSANPPSANLNQNVTLTSTVTPGIAGTPTGTVSFLDGTTQLGTSPVNGSGIATFSISTLAAGSHSITAAYSGDGNFNGSTSTVLSLIVTAPNFSLTSSTLSPSSIAPGTSAKSTITINPVGGMNPSSLTLSCSVSPVVNPAATCSLGTITVENGTGTATLTVATTGPQAALVPLTNKRGAGRLFALALMIPAMLFGGAGLNQSGRRKLMSFCLVFLVIGGCLLQAACGNSGGTPETPAGSYTVTITGSSNGTQHTTSASLTVQ